MSVGALARQGERSMSDNAKQPGIEGGDSLEKMSSEEIEVRAIEDATRGETLPTSKGGAETEQDVEYVEKRELAVDERENADPTRH
jgi:hypothetical protein